MSNRLTVEDMSILQKYYDYEMDDDERINQLVFDLMTARKLGCEYLRGFGTPEDFIQGLQKKLKNMV